MSCGKSSIQKYQQLFKQKIEARDPLFVIYSLNRRSPYVCRLT